MARFKAKETVFVDGMLYEAGDEFAFNGEPSPAMDPVDDDARKLAEDAAARRRVEAQKIAAGATAGAAALDTSAIDLKVEQAIGRVNAVEASAKAAADKAAQDIRELDRAVSTLTQTVADVVAQLDALKALAAAPAPAPAPAAPPADPAAPPA